MRRAVVLLSGGLDSATILAMAQRQEFTCYAMSLDYGQRNQAELEAAKKIAHLLGSQEHQIIKLDLAAFGGSALTNSLIELPISSEAAGIPHTYVPARNTIMLSLALAWAETLDCQDIFIGVNAVDYSGYPDCRPEYILAYERMANLATKAAIGGRKVTIHAPLIHLPKREIIQLGIDLGIDYRLTISCYQADEMGQACGICDSCRIRHNGFVAAGKVDQTRYQTQFAMKKNDNE